MGKKTKQRKPNNKSKQKSTNQTSSSSTKEGGTATTTTRKHDGPASENTNLTSLYAIYKYCTQNVIEWGKSTYLKQLSSTTSRTNKGGETITPPTTTKSTTSKQQQQKEVSKIKKRKEDDENLILEFSLSKIIFQCLGTVAKNGIEMPEMILNDLRTAISYRKRVSTYYKAAATTMIPTSTTATNNNNGMTRSFYSHQWLIFQLERLEKIFSSMQQQQQQQQTDSQDDSTNLSLFEQSNRFGLLSLSDDEDDDEDDYDCDEKADNVSSRRQQRQPASSTSAPSAEELQAEERMFAVALVLAEIAEARMKLKDIWKKWASLSPTNDDDDASELLGATACTEYTLSALQKLVFQTSMTLGDDDDNNNNNTNGDDMFNQILKSYGDKALLEDEIGLDQTLVVINQCVTLRSLQKRPELNGQDGRITQPMDENGRYSVELFPNKKDEKSYTENSMAKKSTILSVKPENLVLSDNTCFRLSQVYEALQSFSFDSVPEPPARVYNSPTSDSVQNACISLLVQHYDRFSKALKVGDFAGVLHLTVRHLLPLWVSLARYCPDTGAASLVLQSYLREFDKSRGRQIKFHFALALIVAIDSAFAVSEENAAREENAKDVYAKVLKRTFDSRIYQSAISLFEKSGFKSGALYSHFEFTRHYWEEYQPMCSFVPWIGGELLLDGLRMHFVCGSGVPYSFVQDLSTMLHIYWILRSEGILGKIAEIDDTLIRMYRKQVFFRGGVPQKGSNAYLKSWQLALGAVDLNSARLLDGRITERRSRQTIKDLSMSGLYVTEISKLRDILQWKTMPVRVGDIGFCHQQIMEIAKEEYYTIYTAPLMSACLNILRVQDSLRSVVPTAQASGKRMVQNYDLLTSQLNDSAKICFWCASLADNRSLDQTEKQAGLSLVAKHFRDVFHEELRTNDEPSLNFSPYTHEVDKSLFGEEGVKSKAHL